MPGSGPNRSTRQGFVRQGRGRPAITSALSLPAPVGGLNTVDPASAVPPTDCLQLYNLVAGEFGLRSRLGSVPVASGLDGPVRSMHAFTGNLANGGNDRLFACTASGLWYVNTNTGTATRVVTFPVNNADSGYGVSQSMVTAGGRFLLYTDEANGYYTYSEASGAWTKVTLGAGAAQVSGVDPSRFVYVAVWKARVWFVERDTATAWYLDAGAIYGTAKTLPLGNANQFRTGGPLVGIYNWTVDGGAGLDDYLVFVSGAGDVAVYQGTNPDLADSFGLRGTWTVGGLPKGRRIASTFGGDVLLITKSGLRALSELVSGGVGQGTYATAKIGNLVSDLMLSRSDLRGWALYQQPEDNVLLLAIPTADGAPTEQLAMSLYNRSWSRYRDLSLMSAATWNGKLYLGTHDGRVRVSGSNYDTAGPINWSLLTSFSNLGNGRQKRVQLIRPTFVTRPPSGAFPDSPPKYAAEPRYRFDLRDVAATPGGVSMNAWSGGLGAGPEFAIALRGETGLTARTVLTGIDVVLEQGGIL